MKLNLSEPTPNCPSYQLPPSSQWFGVVRCGDNASKRFGVFESPRTSGLVRVSSGLFDRTEPPRKKLTKPTGMVRVCLRQFDDTKYRTSILQGKYDYRSIWNQFGVVQPHQTFWNHCDEGEAGRKGSLELVWGGSTGPTLLEAL